MTPSLWVTQIAATAAELAADAVGIEVLERITLLEELDKEQLKRIQPLCQMLEVGLHQPICREGDHASHVFFVSRGKVDLRFKLPGRGASKEMTVSTMSMGV